MARQLRILLVEDSQDDAELLRRDLARIDAVLSIVRVDTDDGMRRALATSPLDLVLAEDDLPSFSASAALSVLHEHAVDIPFIVVAGTIGELRAVELMRLGAHDFVFKSDLRELERVITRELREAADRTARRAAERRKDQLLAILGDELRTPLAPIVTALELMHMRGTDSDHEVNVIKQQVEVLRLLVEDLSEVSRLTRGDVVLRRAPVDLREVVRRAIEITRPLVEHKHHDLSVDAETVVSVAGDRDRLTQLVSNLVSNAAKYTPREGHITLRLATEAGTAVISVEDDGPGIDADLASFVLDPFAQCPQALDRARGGLGLAIATSLAELHGGTISFDGRGGAIDSAPGRGSKFTVRLPLAPIQAAAPTTLTDVCVLIVDDNVDGAHLLAEFLGDLGYKTCVAHDGPSALRLAAQFHPRLALLDIGLPVMDGYELGSRLKREHAQLRMIAITGHGDADDVRRSEQSGFEAHLVKPIDLAGLVSALRAEP